jgi:environmental stress-induced protein Ves
MTPSFRHIPLAAQPSMPWRNGGGVTRQVAIDPPDATLATGFRWRVSVAQVSQAGPFSSLPGIDRSLWLVRGNGMRLSIDGRAVALQQRLQRVDFAGEHAVSAELIDGACEDCNVMTRRGVVRTDARIELFAEQEARELSACAQRLVLVLSGRVSIASPTGMDRLELLPGDAVLVESKNATLLSSLQRSTALSIAFDPIP